jgi:hypothetical protein
MLIYNSHLNRRSGTQMHFSCNMKSALLILVSLFGSFFMANAQTDSTSAPEMNNWGDGNNAFALRITVLQTYLARPHTVMQLEKTLPHFERRWYDSDTVSYDNGDSIDIRMPYSLLPPNKDDPYFIDVHYNRQHRVTGFHYVIEERQLDVDQIGRFMSQIKAAGYKYDLRYSRLSNALAGNHRKAVYVNPTNKVTVSIYTVDEYRHSIDVTK